MISLAARRAIYQAARLRCLACWAFWRGLCPLFLAFFPALPRSYRLNFRPTPRPPPYLREGERKVEGDCSSRQAQGEGSFALRGLAAWRAGQRLDGLCVGGLALPSGLLRKGSGWLMVFRYGKTHHAHFAKRACALGLRKFGFFGVLPLKTKPGLAPY